MNKQRMLLNWIFLTFVTSADLGTISDSRHL